MIFKGERVIPNLSSKQLSRRSFLKAGATLAGAALLAACAPAGATPTPAPAASQGEATSGAAPAAAGKTMEAWSRMTGIDQDTTKAIFDTYNQKNTMGNKVEFVYITATQGSQADEKLLTAVAGGTAPPLYYADRFTVPQFAHQGFFSDITQNAQAAGVKKEDYYEFAWDEATYKDGIYALSFDTDTRA